MLESARDAIPAWFTPLSSWKAAEKQHPGHAYRCSEKAWDNSRVLQPFLTCFLKPRIKLIRWDKSQKDFKCANCHCSAGLGMGICGGSLLALGFMSILWEFHLDLTFSGEETALPGIKIDKHFSWIYFSGNLKVNPKQLTPENFNSPP